MSNIDRVFSFCAFLQSRRVPMTIPEIARQANIARATAYRYVEAMRAHFPIEIIPGTGPTNACMVIFRRKP